MNALKLIITLVGSLAPLMYFHGQAFYQGRLRYWNLPVDLFPLAFEQTVVYGYVSYTLMGITALSLAFIYMMLAVSVLYNLHEISKFSWARNVFGWIFQKKTASEEGNALTGAALTLSIKTSGAVLFMFMFLLAVISIYGRAEELGKESAENQHRKILESDKPSLVRLKGDTQIEAYPVACSESVCAFLTDKQLQLIPRGKIQSVTWPGPPEPEPFEASD
jgi:hypothetical protein